MLRQIKTKIAQKIPRLPRWGKRGIALLSVLCIAISLFCFPVGALSSFTPTFGAPKFIMIREKDTDNSFAATPDVPKGAVFGSNSDYSYVSLPTVINNPYRLIIRIPFTVNVPKGNYWSGSFKMQPVFLDGNSAFVTPFTDLLIQAYVDSQFSKVFESDGSKGEWVTVKLPPSSSSGYIEFSIGFKLTENFNLKIIRMYFKDFDFKYGLEGEISAENSQNQEEEKANKGGKDSSDKAANAIPSVNEGFGNALKSFVNSMSYAGTEAKLPVPRTYIPSLSGVTDEITLIPEQEYDLSQAINDYLPDTLLQLIRHLFTIALVLYCVYELYGLIQYVLTLKKGGKDE